MNITMAECMRLRDQEHYTFQQIADVAGCSRQNIEERIKSERERQQRREDLAKMLGDPLELAKLSNVSPRLMALIRFNFKSIREFSEVIGWPYGRAYRVASGRQTPTPSEIFEICQVLGIDNLKDAQFIFEG